MTTGKPMFVARWSTGLVVLLLLLCGFYASYRAVHLAVVNDEAGLLDRARQTSYIHLVVANDWHDWESQAHFLATLLAKPCIEFVPLNEITASRLPSLLGLALFLWGVWRIGKEFSSGGMRVLITLALLSNAFLLDFFSLARGYGLAAGFTVLSLSFLMQVGTNRSASDESARWPAGAALWLAFGAALSNMGFLYFYVAVLGVVIWLTWRERLWVAWAGSSLILGVFYLHRIAQARGQNLLYFGGDVGFVHDTMGSLIRATAYDRSVSAGLVQGWAGALALLVLVLAYWSYRQRIHAAAVLCALGMLIAGLCMIGHRLWGVRYPVERAALYLVPLVVLIIGTVAARSRPRWVRCVLGGLLLAYSGVGLLGANLSHTFTWRECADIPSTLLALQKVHQQTGQDVMVATSSSKWTIWYYAEHLLGLHPEVSQEELSYLRTYGWLTVYEWKILQVRCALPRDNPLMPGTTHLLISLFGQDDRQLLATPIPGGLAELHFYPASDTALEMLLVPQRQGKVTIPNGQTYAGEFRHGVLDGQGTGTWPDGRKYVGQFRDGLANGQGMCTSPNGEEYVGEFRDGVPNGRGTNTWADGRKYVGEFRGGVFRGQGTYTWPDGRKYAGQFEDGSANGQGTYTGPKGQKYVGEFRDGTFDGRGTYTWPDGREYVGQFHDGLPDGTGRMTYPDGKVEDGLWKHGEFAGAVPH